MRIESLLLSAILASSGIAYAASPEADLSQIPQLLGPDSCRDRAKNPLPLIRKKIDRFKRESKNDQAFASKLRGWLKKEQDTTVDVSSLNWIRAFSPWLLPESFPAKTAFSECAGALQTFSDSRTNMKDDASAKVAAGAIQEWNRCMDRVFPKEKPAEFLTIQKCLDQAPEKKAAPAEPPPNV